MPAALPELERRKLAIDATRARFEGRPHKYGKVDCAKVAAFHMRQFGHRPSFAKAGTYRNAFGAARALRRTGHPGIAEWLIAGGADEISGSLALPGDLMVFEAQGDGLDATTIVLGNGAVLGFHDDAMEDGLLVIRLSLIGRAFRL